MKTKSGQGSGSILHFPQKMDWNQVYPNGTGEPGFMVYTITMTTQVSISPQKVQDADILAAN
jgi:hypothetical protein